MTHPTHTYKSQGTVLIVSFLDDIAIKFLLEKYITMAESTASGVRLDYLGLNLWSTTFSLHTLGQGLNFRSLLYE